MSTESLRSWEEAVVWLRAQPSEQGLVLDCFYDDPLLAAAQRFAATNEWRATLSILPGAGRALDIGAGRGISSYALAISGWQVTALEPDPSHLVGTGAIRELVNQTRLPIRIVQGLGEAAPFAAASFDLVYVREVLHHARDLNTLCQQVACVLKPGGALVACREHVISQREDLATFLDSHPLHHLYGGENAYLLSEYLHSIQLAGLRIRKVYGHYETAINYFPLNESQWRETVTVPLRARFGVRLANLFSDPRFPWSGTFTSILASKLSLSDNSPGRLYTFVAQKPK